MSVTQRKIGGRTFAVYTAVANHMDDLAARLAESEAECLEQARLNGMGSEREARLIARLAEAEAEIARYNAESRQRQARLAEAERDEGTLLGMIRHQRDVLRECLPYLNESMAGKRPGRSADDIRAAVKALTTDSASGVKK